jgi:hypothetical protein
MRWVGIVGHHACMEEVTFCELVQWVHPSMYMEGNYKKLVFSLLQREIYKETNLLTYIKGTVYTCPHEGFIFCNFPAYRGKRGLPCMPASWEGILEMKWLLAEVLTLLCIGEGSENRPFWI